MTESFANVLQHATEINTRNWPESTVGHGGRQSKQEAEEELSKKKYKKFQNYF